jgi:hypothetical protein
MARVSRVPFHFQRDQMKQFLVCAKRHRSISNYGTASDAEAKLKVMILDASELKLDPVFEKPAHAG